MDDRASATTRIDVAAPDAPGGAPVVRVVGPLTLHTTAELWSQLPLLDVPASDAVRIDLSEVPRCDSAGAALLLQLRRVVSPVATPALFEFATEQVAFMLDVLDRPPPEPDGESEFEHTERRAGSVEQIGDFVLACGLHARDTLTYVGELTAGLVGVLLHPRSIRWKDAISYMARTGADALGIVILINALMGLILAFQMASQLAQYGADLYVADIVGLSITRELGPLMTAILVAGRSGSAFAAEIGTMKVNEEVAALDTMGLARVRFLVLPKVVALLCMMPLLVLFADAAGVLGGLCIGVTVLDQPIGLYISHTVDQLDLWDVGQGLIKAQVYAVLIAAVGCLRGLQTKQGAQGVGLSATSAVVTGIFLIIVADAVLTVMFHYLG